MGVVARGRRVQTYPRHRYYRRTGQWQGQGHHNGRPYCSSVGGFGRRARYGLGTSPGRVTLEAIGKRYGITRERVRQIENHALLALKKHPGFASAQEAFHELERIIDSLGGIVCEDDLLNFMTKDKSMQNHIYFLLVLGD